ncbi:MAG: hypothetical protein F6K28_54590 [Microcoleus sp. SIO2G3]|nr:hypothetical protein [Microcoleus sp. SIO2G3]
MGCIIFMLPTVGKGRLYREIWFEVTGKLLGNLLDWQSEFVLNDRP